MLKSTTINQSTSIPHVASGDELNLSISFIRCMVYAYETEEKKNDNARIRNAHRVHSANESNYK